MESVLGEPDPRLLELYPVKYVPELRENQIVQLKSPDYPKDDVDYAIADESEDEFTEQLSFSFKQE